MPLRRLIFPEDKIMQYDTGKHCVYYHRYHLVWSTKYRYKVLLGDVQRWLGSFEQFRAIS